ncbi:MAG: hypothetical protein AVDCRST_MAG49-1660, partial [uncultured Thermomicrobiales bacterium]
DRRLGTGAWLGRWRGWARPRRTGPRRASGPPARRARPFAARGPRSRRRVRASIPAGAAVGRAGGVV